MGKAAGRMVSTLTPLTPTARRAAFVVAAAELVRQVVEDPSAVSPPLVTFRNLKTPASRRAWLAAALPKTAKPKGKNHD